MRPSRVIATIVLVSVLLGGTDGCPAACACRWKGGKETVECVAANLTAIPAGIAEGTQVLDLTGNHLPNLPREMLLNAGLVNVQRLYLANCTVTNIEETTFHKLTNLVELDLSANKLAAVPSTTFKAVSALRRLMLNHNPISRIENGAFADLPSLTSLELSRCRIESVATKAFHGLTGLLQLKLDNNRLKLLNGPSLAPLQNLHGVELSGNPWVCNCKLREMRQWLVNYNIPYTLPPVCDAPLRLKASQLDSLPVNEFACDPRFTHQPSVKSVGLFVGDNTTLSCSIRADPEVDVTWYWQGLDISNNSLFPESFDPRQFGTRDNGTLDKISLLFITHVTQENIGEYTCIGENKAGYVTLTYTLNVTDRKITAETSIDKNRRLDKPLSAKDHTVSKPSIAGQIAGFSIGVVGAFAVATLVSCLVCLKCLCCLCRRDKKKPRTKPPPPSSEANHKIPRSDGDMCGSVPVIKLDGSPPAKTHHNHVGVGTTDEPIHVISNSTMQYDVPCNRWNGACANGPTSLHERPDITNTSTVGRNKRGQPNSAGWFNKLGKKRTGDCSPDLPRHMPIPQTPNPPPERLLHQGCNNTLQRRPQQANSSDLSSSQSSPASTIILPSNSHHRPHCASANAQQQPKCHHHWSGGGHQTTDEDCDDSTTVSSSRSHQLYAEVPRWQPQEFPPPPPEADNNYDMYEFSPGLPPPPPEVQYLYDKPRAKPSPVHSDDERMGCSSGEGAHGQQRVFRTLPHPPKFRGGGGACGPMAGGAGVVLPVFPAHVLPRVRESPDEGYEDEGEEGTEV